ncbi:MAG: NADPH-dependent F420 reductase [Chloroflexi bacterium]|nr:NADPH-dependent F420 reductase [Chloroflexota bacterium]
MVQSEDIIDEPIILTIAILGGTGNQGPGLALRWANAGYRIIIGSRQEKRAQATADELNEKLGSTFIRGMRNEDAAKNANICVLTVVATAHQEVLENLKDALQGKILIDVTAKVVFPNADVPSPPSAARVAQNILGDGVRVVAAFQNVPSHMLALDLDEPLDLDVLVFAENAETANEAMMLSDAGGMNAYYAGGLDKAIVVEGITAVLVELNRRYGSKDGAIKITGIEK